MQQQTGQIRVLMARALPVRALLALYLVMAPVSAAVAETVAKVGDTSAAGVLTGAEISPTVTNGAAGSGTDEEAALAAARVRFGQAEWALKQGDLARFATLNDSLQDYPLAPDLAVAALVRRLGRAQSAEVEALLEAYAGTAPGERLRRLWLGRLAEEKRWGEYVKYYVDNGSETRECLYRRALRHTGKADAAFAGLDALYLTGGSLPDVCDPLFSAWSDSGQLDPDLVWKRIELALARGNDGTARYQRHYLPAADQPWLAFRLQVAEGGSQFPSPPAGQHPRRDRILGAALADYARRRPDEALELLTTRFSALPPAAAGPVHAAAGLALAGRGDSERALAQLDQLPPGAGSLRLQQQRLRVGLKLGAWEALARWIQALPVQERNSAEWQYWLGRALEESAPSQTAQDQVAQVQIAQKDMADGETPAQAAYRRAAKDRSLWGFLAAERLGVPLKIAHQPAHVSLERMGQLLDSPRAARLRELKALGRDVEIRREWREYGRALERAHQGDAQRSALMEAAALARALDFPTQAILILARSGYWDDLELRFPLLYVDLTEEAAQATGLPQSWLLAIIRQESIFNPDVASPANAIGLMQVLPSTAREVAQRIQAPIPDERDLTDPASNVRLGSAYLDYLNERFDDQDAVATAAYNAGPTAVGRWLPERPMQADVWIATIPYYETRNYVARVLTYRMLYDYRLGRALPRLSELLTPVRKS
ncbi:MULTISPECIES: transglycosylase SLT domain-containing protein [Thiorhodovibrio]|uniref:transglycosylase SLT domain-containing protein n=1 Tax=Thiorhodovibrio TaxID=61593 RepID=UPI00191178E7|nr:MULTISPECIES: transglycosylase SLT domain-containing protein [Thiorhodovibrio]WPL11386.1 Soluble lytic murein transglycosylase precursor [Thiorhodovibrio litoralis]